MQAFTSYAFNATLNLAINAALEFKKKIGIKSADNKTIHLLNYVSLNVDLQLPNLFKHSCTLPESMTNSRIDNVRLIAIVLDSSP